jgi:predicted nicotinamide N-methyase
VDFAHDPQQEPDLVVPISPLPPSALAGFALRTEDFTHGDVRWTLALPASSEDLFDAAAFERDERLPYWADLWPSAKRLARLCLDEPARVVGGGGTVLELGCGVGLVSLALLARGARPIATDYEEDALRFARWNAERNGLGPLEARPLDWREPPSDLRVDRVVGADVLYEKRNALAIASLLARVLAPSGEALLADPRRPWRGAFIDALRVDRERSWSIDEIALGPELGPGGTAIEIVLLRVRRG